MNERERQRETITKELFSSENTNVRGTIYTKNEEVHLLIYTRAKTKGVAKKISV